MAAFQMPDILMPDYAGSALSGFEHGRAMGQKQKYNGLARTAASAYGAPRDQALADMAGVDPEGAQQYGANLQKQDDNYASKAASAARFVVEHYKAGDVEGAKAAYRCALPALQRAAQMHGAEAPPELDDSHIAGLEAMASAGDPQQRHGVVTPDGNVVDTGSGDVLYHGQAAWKRVQVPREDGVLVDMETDGHGNWRAPQYMRDGAPEQATDAPAAPMPAPTTGGGGAELQGAVADAITPYGGRITSTTGGHHNPGSKHYSGDAIDVGMGRESPEQQQQIIASLEHTPGLRVVDERQRPAGQAVWGGPHVHVERTAGDATPAPQQGHAPRLGIKPAPAPKAEHPPSGYRWADSAHTSVLPLTGGPADHKVDPSAGLSHDAVTNAAWRTILTGDSGVRGYGKDVGAQRAAINNEVARIAAQSGVSPQELATTAGRNKALMASLTNIQKLSDVMEKSERGFQNNTRVLLDLSKRVDRTGSPVVNKWVLGSKAAMGDPQVAALDAAINTAAADYARIMGGQTGAGGTPIATQQEAREMIKRELSHKSLSAVIDVLNQDIAGQQAAVKAQREAITGAARQFGSSSSAPKPRTLPTVTTKAQFDALPSGATFVEDGKTYRKP